MVLDSDLSTDFIPSRKSVTVRTPGRGLEDKNSSSVSKTLGSIHIERKRKKPNNDKHQEELSLFAVFSSTFSIMLMVTETMAPETFSVIVSPCKEF